MAGNVVVIHIQAKDNASNALKGIEKNVGQLTSALKLAAVAGAAALGAIGVASVKSAADFERTMSQSVALAGLLPEELDKVTAALKEMGPAMGKSPQELAEGFYFASSAGLDTEKALAAVTSSAKASAAGLGETKVVVDAVTSVMNAYTMSADQAGRVTDTLVATVKEGKGEPAELAMAIGKVIPVASQMGVSFEEVGASLAIMTRIGLNADEATTALRGALNALIAPSAEANTQLKAMGTSADEVRKAIKERGLAAVLVEMMDALEGNDEALSKIFPDIRAFTGVLATAGNQGDAYTQVLKSIQGDLGITDKAFATASETFSFKANQVKASLEVLKIQIGNELLPVLKNLADWFVARLPDIQAFITNGIENFKKALDDNRQTLLDAAAGIKNLGAALMAFGGWVISNKVAMVGALLAIGAALVTLTGPVGIVAGILGIASAIGVLGGSADTASSKLAHLINVASNLDELPGWINKAEVGTAVTSKIAKLTLPSKISKANRMREEDFIRTPIVPKVAKTPAWGNAPTSKDIGLFNDYTGAVGGAGSALGGVGDALDETTEALTEEQQALIDLTAAVNASGLTWDQYSTRLNVVGQFMDDFDLSAEQMVDILQRSGLAADEFYQRLEALTILEDLQRDAEDAADAVNGIYDAFSRLYSKPTQEEADLNLRLAQLKLQRAERIAEAGPGANVNTEKFDEQIDAIEAEIAVRRANRDIQEAEMDAANAALLLDADQQTMAAALIDQMGQQSAISAAVNTQLFFMALNLQDVNKWMTDLVSGASGGSSGPSPKEIYDSLSDAGKKYVDEIQRQINEGTYSYQHGGTVPGRGPQLAVVHGGETIIPQGQKAGGFTNYGNITVVAPAGSGNSLSDLERWLR